MRGDRPSFHVVTSFLCEFTPHARGSTSSRRSIRYCPLVYPACAGIDRLLHGASAANRSLPRMRGDRPTCWSVLRDQLRFTPHARGSTVSRVVLDEPIVVYPACAGIDLRREEHRSSGMGLPRMRGDRPPSSYLSPSLGKFTPHARGSTHLPTS